MGMASLSLAFDLVMIRSLVGMIKSPLTIVWMTRGSFKLYSFDKAITLDMVRGGLSERLEDLLLSNLVVSCKVDRVLKPLAKNDLESILTINLNL